MTIAEAAPLITSIGVLITALTGGLSLIVSLLNGRIMRKVEHHTDGIVEKLSDAKHKQGDAEGHARGLEEGRNDG